MDVMSDIKARYNWTHEDEENLRVLASLAEQRQEWFIDTLYHFIESHFADTEHFLPNDQVRQRHRQKVKTWFVSLFRGPYDASYFRRIYRIGETHVKIGLPPGYVNASIYRIRGMIEEMVRESRECSEMTDRILRSADKILDINLDVITSAYREEELKLYLAAGKTHKTLVEFIRRLSYGMDTFIAVSLILAGAFIIFWVGHDIFLMLSRREPLERISLSILGGVLILYAIGELLAEAVKHLRGGSINLNVFIGLALAAVVRKIIVVSLYPEKTAEISVLSLLLGVLGVTFYLVNRAAQPPRV